jgi:hypothetical protein
VEKFKYFGWHEQIRIAFRGNVAVRHHLAGMELLLSFRYMVLLRCSYCCSSREHEFLDLREFLRVIELLRTIQENWFIPNKKHCYMGSTRNWNLYSVLGNSKDQSSIRVTQAAACDWSATWALGIKLSLRKLVLLPSHFQVIPKSCDLLLIVPCLFPTLLGRMFSRDYGDSLYGSCPSEVPFQESMFKLTGARLLGDSIPRRTKQNRISY